MRLRTIAITASGVSLGALALACWWATTAVSLPSPVARRDPAPSAGPSGEASRGAAVVVAAVPTAPVARPALGAAPDARLTPEEGRARDARRVATQVDLLTKAFAADRRDPVWSPQAEQSLREAFAEAQVPGARLEEATCGAALCRVTYAFDSIAQRDDAMGAVVSVVRWRSRGFADVSPDDPLRYVFYTSRDPDSFPTVQ